MVTVSQTQGRGNYQEAPVTRPRSPLCVCMSVPADLQADGPVCCVSIYVSPVCMGSERSGCVCLFSTMKSFLKPVNNVKGKQRGEVEPPNWVPVLH